MNHSPLEIDYISGKKTKEIFGISRFNNEIFRRIPELSIHKIEFPTIWKGDRWTLEGGMKRTIYPFIVTSKKRKGNIRYLTDQDLAFLAFISDLSPSIITCHDLIPWTYYKNNGFFWKLNLKGLQKADHIVSISEFTRNEILSILNKDPDSITTVPNGVDRAVFRPLENNPLEKRPEYKNRYPILLYTGSEEPRKNFPYILQVVHRLVAQYPNILLIKIGKSQIWRKKNIRLIQSLDIQNQVIFLDYLPDSVLTQYYNIADVFVFPSFYEGFGLPPLEAMACGCPVIVADRTSLPEVVGDAGVYINPDRVDSCIEATKIILNDKSLKMEFIRKGFERAKMFDWDVSAEKMKEIFLSFSNV